MSDGNVNTGVVRVGDTVRRAQNKASGQIHALLLHLEKQGFDAAPRFLGVDIKGREILSFVPGTPGLPTQNWHGEETLTAAAKLLCNYHDATKGFLPNNAREWMYRHPDPARHEVICHTDFAPYNLTFDNGLPVGIFDFDLAGPGPRIRDVAYLAFWMVPLAFHAEDLKAFAHQDLRNHCHRLKLFCAAYGIACNATLLTAIRERLFAMHDPAMIAQMIGEDATMRLKLGGHLDYWKAEAEAFDRHASAIAHNLN